VRLSAVFSFGSILNPVCQFFTVVLDQTASKGALRVFIRIRLARLFPGAYVTVTNNDTGQIARQPRTGVDAPITLSLIPPVL